MPFRANWVEFWGRVPMTEILQFLERHAYVAVFAAIMGRQACLPVPSNLLLVAAGALARAGNRPPAEKLTSTRQS